MSPLGALADRVRGRVLRPGDPDYAAACTPYNREVAWGPDAVVRCRGQADVAEGVRFAREHDLAVAVRGGGTGAFGASAGSLLLDLSPMDHVAVDPTASTVRVGGGAIWRSVDHETAAFGLAAPGAQTDWVGVAGYTLGGGFSWLGRRFGWGADNLRSLTLVDADGRLRVVDDAHDEDLFWAARGSGWNFGVATDLTVAVHPVTDVFVGDLFWSAEHLVDVVDAYDRWTDAVPPELTSELSILRAPAGLPGTAAGAVVVRVGFCWAGPDPAGGHGWADRLVASVGRPFFTDLRVTSHRHLQGLTARFLPPGLHQRYRMEYLDALSGPALRATAAAVEELPPLTLVIVHHYRGAIADVAEDATAMSHRRDKFNFMVNARWWPLEDGSPALAWQDALLAQVRPHSTGNRYVNYLFDEPERVPSAYNPGTYRRLAELKARLDPANVFRCNQNIPPALEDST